MSEETREDASARRDRASMEAFYGCSEAAFEALVDRWWPRLFGFFRRYGLRAEDAEDLVLQTFVKLYATKERQNFDLRRPLSPFLFTVARNEYLGWRRSQEGEVSTVPLIEALDLASGSDDPHSALAADVACCIEKLPDLERQYALHCGKHGLGDMSHGEIAKLVKKQPSQVTGISQCARKLVERCLRAKGYGTTPCSGQLTFTGEGSRTDG